MLQLPPDFVWDFVTFSLGLAVPEEKFVYWKSCNVLDPANEVHVIHRAVSTEGHIWSMYSFNSFTDTGDLVVGQQIFFGRKPSRYSDH